MALEVTMVAVADTLVTSCHVLLRDPDTRRYWFGRMKTGSVVGKRLPPGGYTCADDSSLADAAVRSLRAQWKLDPEWLRRFHSGALRLVAAVGHEHPDQPRLSRNVFYFMVDYAGSSPVVMEESPLSDPKLYSPDRLTDHILWPADRLWLPVVLHLQPVADAYCARYTYADDEVFCVEYLREPPATRLPLFRVTAR